MAGGACLLAGDGENGTRLLGASDSVYEAAGGVRPDGFFADRYQGWVQTARSLLGDRRVAELMAAGRGLGLADAVGIAHEEMKDYANPLGLPRHRRLSGGAASARLGTSSSRRSLLRARSRSQPNPVRRSLLLAETRHP